VSDDREHPAVRFEALRPAPRGRLILAAVVGPILWLLGLVVAAWVVEERDAIGIGLLVAAVSLLVALLVLALLRAARRRRERRYVDGR
jgi:hypothetical protein